MFILNKKRSEELTEYEYIKYIGYQVNSFGTNAIRSIPNEFKRNTTISTKFIHTLDFKNKSSNVSLNMNVTYENPKRFTPVVQNIQEEVVNYEPQIINKILIALYKSLLEKLKDIEFDKVIWNRQYKKLIDRYFYMNRLDKINRDVELIYDEKHLLFIKLTIW